MTLPAHQYLPLSGSHPPPPPVTAGAKILHLILGPLMPKNHRQSIYSDPDIRGSVSTIYQKVSPKVSCIFRCEKQGRIDKACIHFGNSLFYFLWQVIISPRCKSPASLGLKIINQIKMDIESSKNNFDYTGSQVRQHYAN